MSTKKNPTNPIEEVKRILAESPGLMAKLHEFDKAAEAQVAAVVVPADEAFDARVVATNGSMSWTRGELQTLFSAVQDRENWKNPIDALVPFHNDRDLLGTIEAVIFFAGCVPTIRPTKVGNIYRVEAIGYYMAVGA